MSISAFHDQRAISKALGKFLGFENEVIACGRGIFAWGFKKSRIIAFVDLFL